MLYYWFLDLILWFVDMQNIISFLGGNRTMFLRPLSQNAQVMHWIPNVSHFTCSTAWLRLEFAPLRLWPRSWFGARKCVNHRRIVLYLLLVCSDSSKQSLFVQRNDLHSVHFVVVLLLCRLFNRTWPCNDTAFGQKGHRNLLLMLCF